MINNVVPGVPVTEFKELAAVIAIISMFERHDVVNKEHYTA
jgi:hypothetical protein